MPLGMEAELGPGNIVLDGDPAPPNERGTAVPHFSAHGYYGQIAGWIRILFGMEVGLGPGDVSDDDPAPPPNGKGHSSHPPPLFATSIVAKWLPISATAELLIDAN